MRQILRYAGFLFALQAVFSGITFLLSEFGWVSMLVAPVSVALVWKAGQSFGAEWDRSRGSTLLAATVTGLLWQIPGLQGTVRFVTDTVGWTEYDGVTDLQDFAMQTWHTVILPPLGALPNWKVAGYYAPYYIGVVLGSVCFMALFAVAAVSLNGRNRQ